MTHGRIIDSTFAPRGLYRNPHLQTLLPTLPFTPHRRVSLRREILELPDGDETAVDWVDAATSPERPLLVVLHGLESSSESSYAQMLLAEARDAGWDACVMNFRDCGDYRNRLHRRYHAGETGDLTFFLERLKQQRDGPLVAAGYSLGGNVLLKYLGESASQSLVDGAAAVCVPLDLQACSNRLKYGFSRVYQRHLINNMKRNLRRRFKPGDPGIDWDRALNATTFDEFDDAVTAPLHGFEGKDDYYAKSSSIRFVDTIQTPTLIVQAKDDPFMSESMLPGPETLAAAVTLELSAHGGHVGFIEGGWPINPRYYLPKRLMEFLKPLAEPSETA